MKPFEHPAEAIFKQNIESLSDIGYGRMMQIISHIWYEKDPIGALSVGPCYGSLKTGSALGDIEKLEDENKRLHGFLLLVMSFQTDINRLNTIFEFIHNEMGASK